MGRTGETAQAGSTHGDDDTQVAAPIGVQQQQDGGAAAHGEAVPQRERRRRVSPQAGDGGLCARERGLEDTVATGEDGTDRRSCIQRCHARRIPVRCLVLLGLFFFFFVLFEIGDGQRWKSGVGPWPVSLLDDVEEVLGVPDDGILSFFLVFWRADACWRFLGRRRSAHLLPLVLTCSACAGPSRIRRRLWTGADWGCSDALAWMRGTPGATAAPTAPGLGRRCGVHKWGMWGVPGAQSALDWVMVTR